MKTLKLLPALSLFTFSLARVVAAEEVVVERIPLTPPQIEELVAPIALYPDPLVALILPASTFPSDVVLAARFLERGGSVESVSAEPWDDSVRALSRYREVIDYLDNNLDWTRRLGYCFLDQPDAVMDAIQTVRIRARTAGLLQDSAQQEVIVETEEIRIVPADPTVIYIPRYDPFFLCGPVYPTYHYRSPFISFGIGWRVGTWLNFDCDWRARGIRIVHRPSHWYHRPDWRDRNRYTHYTSTHWTRRNHSRHDDRFDRSPRYARYTARGADHRNATNPVRYDQRVRDGIRGNDDNRRDYGRNSGLSRSDRSRGWDGRQRPATANPSPQIDLNPAGAAVIPPVATPMPETSTPVSRFRRPDAGASNGLTDRFNASARSRRDRDAHDRLTAPAPTPRMQSNPTPRVQPNPTPRVRSAPAPEVARPQPRVEAPPARRSEASERSNDRGRSDSRNDSHDRGNPGRSRFNDRER